MQRSHHCLFNLTFIEADMHSSRSPVKSSGHNQADNIVDDKEKARRERKNKSLFANFVSEANAFFHASDFAKAEGSFTQVVCYAIGQIQFSVTRILLHEH